MVNNDDLDPATNCVIPPSTSKPSTNLIVSPIEGRSSNKREPNNETAKEDSLEPLSAEEKSKKERPILKFQDNKMLDGIPSMKLSLVMSASVDNHTISRFHIDDMYAIFVELVLGKYEISPYEGRNLHVLNDSITRLCSTKELLVSFGKGRDKRMTTVCFLVIPCERVYNHILGRPFLTSLNVVDSMTLLKMKYYKRFSEPVVISTNLHEFCLIHETIMNDP